MLYKLDGNVIEYIPIDQVMDLYNQGIDIYNDDDHRIMTLEELEDYINSRRR